MRRPLLLVFVFNCSLLSAQERPRPYPVTPQKDWLAAAQENTRGSDGRPAKAMWTSYARYVLSAELLPAEDRVRGHAQLTFVNRSPKGVTNLVVFLRQNLNKEDALRNTEVAITGGISIEHLTLDEHELTGDTFQVHGTLLAIDLPEELAPGKETALAMDFAFKVPPAGGAPRMGQEDHHVFYLGYWYPQFAVYDDLDGWVADPYLGTSEFYMDYADYEVAFKAPVNWLVRATGELQNPQEVLTDAEQKALAEAATDHDVVHVTTKEDLQHGTATRAADSGTLTWKFKAGNVRDFAISVSDRYLWDATHAVIKDLNGPGKDGTCMIHAVYRPRERAWRKAARYAQHTIEYVSANLHPYPWPHMTACEGIIGGGMEYPMMTLIGGAEDAMGLEGLFAHELIHMWFPMQVGSNETAYAWQDEGLTDFVTDFVTADFWRREDVGGHVFEEYAAVARMLEEEPLMRHGDHYATEMAYEFASYTKPAAILHQLVGMFGREAVLTGMRHYVEAWSGKHPTPYDFFQLMNGELHQNLDWYWREWAFETWHLDTAIGAVHGDDQGTVVTLEDRGEAMMPTVVRAQYADHHAEEKTVDVKWWLDGHRKAEVQFGPGVVQVEIDPDHVTMDLDRTNNLWKK